MGMLVIARFRTVECVARLPYDSGQTLFYIDQAMAESQFLDAKGMKCPLPVLRARKAMKDVDVGGLLRVEATDPGSVQDFRAFCETTGHELLDSQEDDGVYFFIIRKTA